MTSHKLTGKSETEIISSICFVVWGRWGEKEKGGGEREMTSELTKEEKGNSNKAL